MGNCELACAVKSHIIFFYITNNQHNFIIMADRGEWLSTRKRDRRSYDNSWSTYEARGSGRSNGGAGGNEVGGGGLDHFRGGQNNNNTTNNANAMDRNNITAQGERIGVPHNDSRQPPPQHHQQQPPHCQHQQQQNRGIKMVAEVAPVGPYGASSSQYEYGASRGSNNNNDNNGSSRVRVADYRGAAARVGALPAQNGPPPNVYQTDSSYRGSGGIGGRSNSNSNISSNNNNISLFQNADFLQTLSNPPPITATLPPDLRSTLNDEQTKVVESILSGHSTFFTGPAGSGKSHVLQTLLKANKAGIGGKNGGKERKIFVTATTGVAACNVGGTTVHAFAGVGVGTGSLAELAKRVMGNEYTKGRWREVDILIIDEISMMAGSFLDKLNFVSQRARNDRRAFGGVQLVVCGDFFQVKCYYCHLMLPCTYTCPFSHRLISV